MFDRGEERVREGKRGREGEIELYYSESG